MLKTGKKRKSSHKLDEMKTFFQDAEDRHQKFLSDLMSKQRPSILDGFIQRQINEHFVLSVT